MKKVIGVICVMVGLVVGTMDVLGLSPEMERIAEKGGAKVCMTFHVTDTQGNPVTNAQVDASFYFWHKDGADTARFVTDTNGMCKVEGRVSIDIQCSFIKDGYYGSAFHRTIMTRNAVVKDDKWQPWNPTITITLKEKRKGLS